MRTKILMMLMGLLWLPFNQSAYGQHADEDKKEPLVVKLYDVSDLIAADYTPSYSSDVVPGTGMFRYGSQQSIPTVFGGLGGGGMGGGSGAGGGGLFAVPQAMGGGQSGGGMGMGGGSGGYGGGGFYGSVVPRSGEEFDLLVASSELETLIMNSVDTLTWEQNGGESGATTSFYNGQMVVTQTEDVHQKVDSFLSMLREANQNTKVIQLEWIAVPNQVAAEDLAGYDDETLAEFVSQAWTQRGSVSVLNGRVGYTTAAEHRNIVISVTPVVGAGSDDGGRVGYSPKTAKPALGWLVQMRPLIPAGDEVVGRIQVGASYTSATEAEEARTGQIDRGNIHSFQVGGLVQSKANRWTVVGGMAGKAEGAGQKEDQYYLMVRWNQVKSE